MTKPGFKSVDEYIGTFPKDVQVTLRTLRRALQKAVPGAEEGISYQMPVVKFHGRLVYFAAFKTHYSLFTSSRGVRRAFRKELSRYEGAKGTLRFPLHEPVPVTLIAAIAKHFAQENLAREQQK